MELYVYISCRCSLGGRISGLSSGRYRQLARGLSERAEAEGHATEFDFSVSVSFACPTLFGRKPNGEEERRSMYNNMRTPGGGSLRRARGHQGGT